MMGKMQMTRDEAEDACWSAMDDGGWLLDISSREEIDEIARELIIRHIGGDLHYWVYGNVTDNVTASQLDALPLAGISKDYPPHRKNGPASQILRMSPQNQHHCIHTLLHIKRVKFYFSCTGITEGALFGYVIHFPGDAHS